ncbi:MAG TPA: DUF1707 domain-containing protein [Solirubrobacteraceae bacterium]
MADEPEHPAMLAGDRDRDDSIEQLSGAVAEGRLTLEEFSDRVELAQAARTQPELAVLTRDLPATRPETPPAQAPGRHRAIFSKLVRRGPWELEPRSSCRCIFGTVTFDLTQARLSGAETELDVYNLFGTVTLIVPEEVQITVTGGGAFASQVIDTPRPTAAGAPRLRISARGPGGTLYVRSPRGRPLSRSAGRLRGGTADTPPRS